VSERNSAIPYINALDGARGLAVAAVLLFHGGHLLGGYLGVDFFFVLSGFLITSLLLAGANRTGGVALGSFWARRARRLLPALAVLLVGVALYCLVLGTPRQFTQIRGDAFATLGYAANWHEIFARQNYFTLFTAPSPLNHTWSLAIEEQFYVVWPLVIVAVLAWWKRDTARAVLVLCLALAAISTVLMIVVSNPDNVSRAYFGTDTRAAAILFGAALAAWLAGHQPARRRGARIALEALALIGVVVLAIAWTRLDGQSSTLYHGGFLVCGLAATAIIAAAVHPQRGPVASALSFRPLCALGLISYGVYLYHWPIDVAFDEKRMGFGGWPLFGFQTLLTIVLAVLSYRFIEQPIRHGAGSSIRWRKLTPVIAAALVVVLAVSTAGARSEHQINPLRHPLRAATQAFETAPPNAQRVMLVGDSVAHYLGRAAQNVAMSPPVALFNGGIEGCGFPAGVTRARYHNSMGTKLEQRRYTCDPDWQAGVIDRFRPTVVFWIVNNPADSVRYRGRWIDTCSPEYASIYERALHDEIANLGRRGARVVLTTEVYPRYLFADEDRPVDCENAVRRRVAAKTGTQLVDLNAFICPGHRCRQEQDGAVLRVDGEHYEGAGGRLVFRWLMDQVN
jgi:peptidoglycan/LPS O-acetylase OafA/YrhL